VPAGDEDSRVVAKPGIRRAGQFKRTLQGHAATPGLLQQARPKDGRHTRPASHQENEPAMKATRCLAEVCVLVIAVLAAPAHAADRMRAGQWIGTTIVGARTFPTSSCISRSDADAMNGDAKAIRAYLETVIPPAVCKISDVKAEGNQVIYTASCGSTASKVVTTSYHGDRSEGTDSTGAKTQAKLVGPCK
jgi:hypothetical protein